jgi:hypothetical protein
MKYQVTREVLLQVTVEASSEVLAEAVAAETDLDEWTAETKSERIEPVDDDASPAPALANRLRDTLNNNRNHMAQFEIEAVAEAINLIEMLQRTISK